MSLEVRLVAVLITLETRGADNEIEDALYVSVKVCNIDAAVVDTVNDTLILGRTSRLEHIVASPNLCIDISSTIPVCHHGTLESPVIAEYIFDKLLVFRGIGSIDFIV